MLEFIRGDTCRFKFQIKYADDSIVKKDDIETLILTCRKYNSSKSPVLFSKNKDDFTYTDEFYYCTIEPEDTQELAYGTYNFDIKCTLTDGYRKTFKGSFTITEEDTIHESEETS